MGIVILPVGEIDYEENALRVVRQRYVSGEIDVVDFEYEVERILSDKDYMMSFVFGGLPLPTRPDPGVRSRW